MKVKCDHRSKFSNLSNWKEEAWKKIRASTGKIRLENLLQWSHFTFISYRSTNMNYFIYISWFHCTGRNELNKLTLLPMCGFIAQLVEHRTGIRRGHGFESRWSPVCFFQASFQLLKLENLLRWSHFTFRFSLVFTWFSQVYSSYCRCRYLLVFYLVISVQPWQKILCKLTNSKWMLQNRTAQYMPFEPQASQARV